MKNKANVLRDARTCKYRCTCNHMQFFPVHLLAFLTMSLFGLLLPSSMSLSLSRTHIRTHIHHSSYLSLLSSDSNPYSLLTMFGIYSRRSLDSPCVFVCLAICRCVCMCVCVCLTWGMMHVCAPLYGCHGDQWLGMSCPLPHYSFSSSPSLYIKFSGFTHFNVHIIYIRQVLVY